MVPKRVYVTAGSPAPPVEVSSFEQMTSPLLVVVSNPPFAKPEQSRPVIASPDVDALPVFEMFPMTSNDCSCADVDA